MDTPKILGIMGGLGPISGAYFYELLCRHTLAEKDQDHIDVVLSGSATTPDRTAFILSRSSESPLPRMISDARKLEAFGADAIVIACNTAHYFIDEVRASVNVPVPSIIHETVDYIKSTGIKKVGIMATNGTISAGSYQSECYSSGLEFILPDKEHRNLLMELIYDDVKSGNSNAYEKLQIISEHMKKRGCDAAILGCTELSVVNSANRKNEFLIDSLEVLAYYSIILCGKTPVGFNKAFEKWKNTIPERN